MGKLSDEDIADARQYFSEYDRDQNNVIDANELDAFLRSMQIQLTRQELLAAAAEIDKNGTGYIEWGEFLAWWESWAT